MQWYVISSHLYLANISHSTWIIMCTMWILSCEGFRVRDRFTLTSSPNVVFREVWAWLFFLPLVLNSSTGTRIQHWPNSSHSVPETDEASLSLITHWWDHSPPGQDCILFNSPLRASMLVVNISFTSEKLPCCFWQSNNLSFHLSHTLCWFLRGFSSTDETSIVNKCEVDVGKRQQSFFIPDPFWQFLALVSGGMVQDETGLLMWLRWAAVVNNNGVIYMCLSPVQLQRCVYSGLVWAVAAFAFVFVGLRTKSAPLTPHLNDCEDNLQW